MITRKLYILFFLLTLSLEAVEISGTVQYERVHAKNFGSASILDYANPSLERAKQVYVVAIDRSNDLVDSTYTDDNGNYTLLKIPTNSEVKIQVYAKMKKENRWDVKVIDNNNNNSLYGIEGEFSSSGVSNSVRNLTALASTKSSPPFAILDSVYRAMKRVLTVDGSLHFPTLKLNWSTQNITSGTYYDGIDAITLQGDQKGDSDEYDDHILIHEWGHYFERNFSRADNIGGPHGTGEYLDIRVAFGEGFGNALSAILTDDPIYFDTMGSNGWNMNIEHARHDTPGWFSEASIQRILYDLYDSKDDGADRLSLGLKPIYETLIHGERNTPAFTSLFSFIDALKKANPNATSKIDAITANENIATIEDAYGSNRITNLIEGSLPLYHELNLNKTIGNLCTLNHYGVYNKINNHKYVRFNITQEGTYPIQVKQSNGRSSDPEFTLFKTSPFENISTNESGEKGIEKASLALTSGEYLLDIYDSNNIDKACFHVSVGEVSKVEENANPNDELNNNNNEENGSSDADTTDTIGITLPQNTLFSIIIMLMVLIAPLYFIRKELKL